MLFCLGFTCFFLLWRIFQLLSKHLVASFSLKSLTFNEQNWVESFDNEPIYIFTDQVFLTLVLHDMVFASALNEASAEKKAGNAPTNWADHTPEHRVFQQPDGDAVLAQTNEIICDWREAKSA